MMLELCVDNLDMTLKVIAAELYLRSPIVSGSYVCMYQFLDAKGTKLFGGEKGLAFLSEVGCIGSEKKLIECHYAEARNHGCLSAGVTCGKSTSESKLIVIGTLSHGIRIGSLRHLHIFPDEDFLLAYVIDRKIKFSSSWTIHDYT